MIKNAIIFFLFINSITGSVFGKSISILYESIFSINNFSELDNSTQENATNFNFSRNISKLQISYLYNKKYEIGFATMLDIRENNLYLLDNKNEYFNINFKYHINERVNFPLNLTIGTGLITDNSNNITIYKLNISKLYDQREYPLLPYLELKYSQKTFTNILGFKVNLMVDQGDNTSNEKKDIIWFDFSVLRNNNNNYFSFASGLTHPL